MQVFRVLLMISFLAAPAALFAQDKPKSTDKPDDPKAKQIVEELKGVLRAASDKPKADDTKSAKPTDAKPADPKPKQFELEFKIVPNPSAKAKPDEPKAEKPEDLKSKAAKLKEEVQKAAEAEIREAKEKLMKQKEELLKATEALAEAAKKAQAPQKADEPKPADTRPEKAEDTKTAERARLYLRLISEAEKKAKGEEPKPAKPGEPQKPAKPVEVQLQYKVQKDGDADQKLQKLEAQLQALLQEIHAMRAAKPGWEKKPVEVPASPEQKKALRVYPDDKPRVLVVPAQPGAPPIARPQSPAAPGTPAPVYPPAEALERRSVRGRLIERDGGDVINLTRASYTLPAASAMALNDFLKTQVKAKVLETRVEGDRLTVTTTPEVQHIIAQFIALMQGKTPVAAAPGAAVPAADVRDVRWRVLDVGEPVQEGDLLRVAPAGRPEDTIRLWLEGKPTEKKEPEKK